MRKRRKNERKSRKGWGGSIGLEGRRRGQGGWMDNTRCIITIKC